jgi:hypothetical protein
MILKISTIERWLPAIATLWFFVSIDSIIVWNPLSPLFILFAAFGVIWGTMIVKPFEYTPKIRFASFLFLCYALWFIITQSDTIVLVVRRTCMLFPLLFVLSWKKPLLSDTYSLLRRCILFFAIGAAIVSVLSLIGFIHFVPHFTMPPQEPLHERLGYVYDVYGLFVTIHDPQQLLAFRACGMMREPGHFAVILGFIYMIDRYQGRKPNLWIVICGLLTFSANFLLLFLFTEWYSLIKPKNILKILKWIPVALLGLYIVFVFLPSGIKDQIYYLAYGRNLEQVVDVASTSSSMDDALDERASNLPLIVYEKMTFTERLVGIGRYDTSYSLSDYRGMIMAVGWVGLALSTFFYFILVMSIRRSMTLSLLFAFILILLHRSWMLLGPYIYFLAFLAMSTYNRCERKTSNE